MDKGPQTKGKMTTGNNMEKGPNTLENDMGPSVKI